MTRTPSRFIELVDVHHRYTTPGHPEVATLAGVSLRIEHGEFVAILGPSGSGKSTLLNLLTGLDAPTTGTIRVGQALISEMDERGLTRWRGERVGIVFQFFQLLPTITIMENVLLAMEFGGRIPAHGRVARAQKLLDDLEIAGQADKFPSMLSGGQQQRAALARALANEPDLLVADEPTGNLDSRTASLMLDLFVRLHSKGMTIVVVTHDDEVAERTDRVLSMRDGVLVNTSKEAQR